MYKYLCASRLGGARLKPARRSIAYRILKFRANLESERLAKAIYNKSEYFIGKRENEDLFYLDDSAHTYASFLCYLPYFSPGSKNNYLIDTPER